jgi:DNA-directed RNA polymerase alpha subunit
MGGVIAGSSGLIAGGLAGLLASESLKKSKPFAAVIAPIIAKVDQAAGVDFQKFKDFLLFIEQKARRLARDNDQFQWLNKALDWITPADMPVNMELLRRVDKLGLSAQALNVLRGNNIIYVGDLVQITEAEMMLLPNCTRRTVSDIKEDLASIGLHFGMDLRDWPPENFENLEKEPGDPI